MKTAVVILNWNGAEMMRRYLPTVVSNTRGEADIYIADNASEDDSLAVAEAFGDCKLIRLEENYGFAEGYNRALRQVDADYYLLLNSDVEVTAHWIVPLERFMESHQEAAACQPKLLSLSDRRKFEYAGASGGYIDRYGYFFCRGRLFDTLEEDEGQYDDTVEVDWATGAALMIRSADYWRAGGMDGRFFAHCEETDLCWRLRIMGRKIYCVPQSKVYHLGGGTLAKGDPKKTFLNFRNNLTMLYKCLPEEELRGVMRVRCLLDYLAAIFSLLKNRSAGDLRAIIEARRAFKAWQPQFEADRRAIQASRKGGAGERRRVSLLWEYYVRGKRRYSELGPL